MTVAWILKDKGRHVVSVLSGTPVTEAIGHLEKNRIGAVVIVDEQHRVLGILSEGISSGYWRRAASVP